MRTRRIAGAVAASALALGGVAAIASPAMAADGVIDPVGQGVGMPASGTCAAVDDSKLNWGGVSSGGWTASWAEWGNNGKGGPVCVRTLVFDPTSGTWSVQAA